MTRIPTSRLALAAALLTVVVVVSVLAWHQRLGHALVGISGARLAGISGHIHHGLAIFNTMISGRDLAAENLALKDALVRAQADAAHVDELERDNAFLRQTIDLHERLPKELIGGAAFSYPRDGGIQQLLINRGMADGVTTGDIVVTGQGALVGIVMNVFTDHAVVRAVGDPALEITARLADGSVAGLVKNDIRWGLVLDLVQKDETVAEGLTVVTSGNDQFPPGLVIGTVRAVDNESATLFKIVRISSTLGEAFQGRVVIFHP